MPRPKITPAAEPERRFASVQAAAARYDVHVDTIRRRIADGTITGYRVVSAAGRTSPVRVDLVECDAKLLKRVGGAA